MEFSPEGRQDKNPSTKMTTKPNSSSWFDCRIIGEVIHGFGDVIERVREVFRVWPVTVSEARVIGRDKVIVIGKLGEERLEHPRGRWKPVQQEKRRRVLRPASL